MGKGGDQVKSLSAKLGVVLIGLAIFGYSEVWGQDWELLEKIEDTKSYHDEKGAHSPQKIVKVWIKRTYPKGVINVMDLVGRRFENLSYSINSLEFVCEAKLTRFLSMTYFSENGDLLALGDPSDKWESIPPNSMFDALYKIVCK
jgi:Surface-adhesin protein E